MLGDGKRDEKVFEYRASKLSRSDIRPAGSESEDVETGDEGTEKDGADVEEGSRSGDELESRNGESFVMAT